MCIRDSPGTTRGYLQKSRPRRVENSRGSEEKNRRDAFHRSERTRPLLRPLESPLLPPKYIQTFQGRRFDLRSSFIQRQSSRWPRLQSDFEKAQRRRNVSFKIGIGELRRRSSPSGFDLVHATNEVVAGKEEEKEKEPQVSTVVVKE